jgi:hypothetical protein
VATFRGRRIQFPQQLNAVERLNHRKRRRSLACLVRLQVSEQVPAGVQIAGRGDLLECFLDAVFAEVAMADGVGLAHGGDGKCLGDGDQSN